MITLESVRYHSLAIDAISIPAGITSVIGPNGSGKTTLLRLCAGIALPASGTVLIDGIPPRETDVGWVNEFPDKNLLFPRVSDEIASTLRFRHAPCRDTVDAVQRVAGSVGIGHLLSRQVRDLSGGEKVLVSLAAALVHRPKVLVLDEYDSHLESATSDHIAEVIRRSGSSYVLRCTQHMETAALSDFLIYLEHGRVKHAGTPETVFASLSGTPFYPLSWRCRV